MHDYGFMVNQSQSPQERKCKYDICRMLGLNHDICRRLRDWNWSKLQGFVEQNTIYEPDSIKLLLNDAYELFTNERRAMERKIYHDKKESNSE